MDEASRAKMWKEYEETHSAQIREKLIIEYASLVKLVAGRLSMYLGFNVEYDDLVGYGVFGLIDAIDKFDTMKDVKFETYASLRIRGAILDQIRKMDWIPRTIRDRQKKIDSAIREIESEKGHMASDAEIAKRMNISEEEYLNWQSQMKITNVVSLNEFMEQGADIPEDPSRKVRFDRPEEVVEKQELKQMLAEALELLTEREKKVILLYYYQELTLKEISEVLQVSESRVSQLHTRALQRMKGKMGRYMEILTEAN